MEANMENTSYTIIITKDIQDNRKEWTCNGRITLPIDELNCSMSHLYRCNLEHTRKMETVFQVIRSLHVRCYICDAYLHDKPTENIVYIMKRIYVCSNKCEMIALEELKHVP